MPRFAHLCLLLLGINAASVIAAPPAVTGASAGQPRAFGQADFSHTDAPIAVFTAKAVSDDGLQPYCKVTGHAIPRNLVRDAAAVQQPQSRLHAAWQQRREGERAPAYRER